MASGSSVFISYAADIKSRAQELTRALENRGIEAWVDFKDLRPGQRWKDELERAVGDARWLLILVGSGSYSTSWQEAEWSTALARTWLDANKRLIPVVFGENEPPPFLRNWVSLHVDPDKEPATWTRHVLDALDSVPEEIAFDVSGRIRGQRERRFDEISKAAEELRNEYPDEPPTGAKVRTD